MSILLKLIFRLNAIPIKIPTAFVGTNKLNLKFYGKAKNPGKPKQACKRKEQLESSHYLILRLTIKELSRQGNTARTNADQWKNNRKSRNRANV